MATVSLQLENQLRGFQTETGKEERWTSPEAQRALRFSGPTVPRQLHESSLGQNTEKVRKHRSETALCGVRFRLPAALDKRLSHEEYQALKECVDKDRSRTHTNHKPPRHSGGIWLPT